MAVSFYSFYKTRVINTQAIKENNIKKSGNPLELLHYLFITSTEHLTIIIYMLKLKYFSYD